MKKKSKGYKFAFGSITPDDLTALQNYMAKESSKAVKSWYGKADQIEIVYQ